MAIESPEGTVPSLRGTPVRGPLILVVAIGGSIHTSRWLNMMRGQGFRFVLVPIYRETLVEGLEGPLIRDAADLDKVTDRTFGVFDLQSVDADEVERTDRASGYVPWSSSQIPAGNLIRPAHLAAAINRLTPAMVHSMEVQYAGYLCAATKRWMQGAFPLWLLSNWGSDIYLYRKIPEHQPRLAEIAGLIDAYIAECRRDIGIIRSLGYRGHVLPVVPASGGMDFDGLPRLEDLPPPSQRREILIKGYHGWAGRSLHVLSALHLAAPALKDYRVRIMLAGPSVRAMAERLAEWDGLDIACDPYLSDHRKAMMRLGRARAVIGLSISDGISTTLLEAMCMGTLPIQSDTSCGCEWVVPGRTGLLVSPHDVAGLANAIIRAVTSDELVDAAATANRRTVEARWNAAINAGVIADAYRALLRPIAGGLPPC
ncbi:glycosyltransferase [Azospirillum halopraeferens]|uniref:glycosyltransferase n=1 Tax=Azospirillum halopraeferens TaxID=34010 RepID=UPI0003FBFBFE|nr:glycosyltransferase [Azospirillum halopraeferens]